MTREREKKEERKKAFPRTEEQRDRKYDGPAKRCVPLFCYIIIVCPSKSFIRSYQRLSLTFTWTLSLTLSLSLSVRLTVVQVLDPSVYPTGL